MIVVVIVVLAVLVIAAIVWARVSASRSEHKSVETYEHALGVLGEVSKRTESTGFRILPHEETGRPHVGKRIDPAGEAVEGRKEASLRGQGPFSLQALASGRRAQAALFQARATGRWCDGSARRLGR